jgi:hypothetical protein
VTRFPLFSLPDLPIHPGGGPGLYVLDQNSRGLVPRPLLHNPEAATAALEDLFRDTTEGSILLQLKVVEAFGTIVARKMVDNQVRCFLPPLLFPSCSTSGPRRDCGLLKSALS